MSAVADATGISRPYLSMRQPAERRRRGRPPLPDAELVADIRALIADLPTYGYRRVHALLRRQAEANGRAAPNPKRVYRVMKLHGLLLQRHSGRGQERRHDGKIAVATRNTRWCSDGLEIGCDNGEKVRVAFALDCCDREAMGYVATTGSITAEDDQHAERCRDHIEAFSDILTDLVARVATAGTDPGFDIHDLFDPFEVRGQRAAVGHARTIAARPSGLHLIGGLGLGERRLGILEPQLIGIELLGTATEPVTPKSLDDRAQAFHFGVGTLELACLFDDERAERVNVFGKVGFHEHDSSESAEESPVNGNLRCLWPASAMNAAPVQTLEKRAQLRRRQVHDAVLDAGPLEAARLELLDHQAQPRAVPPDQLDPVGALRPKDVDHAREWIAAIVCTDQRRERVRSLAKIHRARRDHHARTGARSDHRIVFRASITAAITAGSAPRPIFTATPSTPVRPLRLGAAAAGA